MSFPWFFLGFCAGVAHVGGFPVCEVRAAFLTRTVHGVWPSGHGGACCGYALPGMTNGALEPSSNRNQYSPSMSRGSA